MLTLRKKQTMPNKVHTKISYKTKQQSVKITIDYKTIRITVDPQTI